MPRHPDPSPKLPLRVTLEGGVAKLWLGPFEIELPKNRYPSSIEFSDPHAAPMGDMQVHRPTHLTVEMSFTLPLNDVETLPDGERPIYGEHAMDDLLDAIFPETGGRHRSSDLGES